jgi:hypothetical protein
MGMEGKNVSESEELSIIKTGVISFTEKITMDSAEKRLSLKDVNDIIMFLEIIDSSGLSKDPEVKICKEDLINLLKQDEFKSELRTLANDSVREKETLTPEQLEQIRYILEAFKHFKNYDSLLDGYRRMLGGLLRIKSAVGEKMNDLSRVAKVPSGVSETKVASPFVIENTKENRAAILACLKGMFGHPSQNCKQ